MERLMLEEAPAPPEEFSAAEVLRHFDKPCSERTDDDLGYFGEVRGNSSGAEENSHQRLVEQFMATVLKARRDQWAHGYVQGEMRRRIEGNRGQTRLGRLGLRIDRWISGE